ncbi:hypothetical protein H4R35_005372 [Dimargaris xerosporica]|nr:hypothetical protein H4R35_005372 [Dimargaris xerosporica]
MVLTPHDSQTPIAAATALDHNPDYRVVSSALVMLENQLQQALLDTETLKAAKDEALKDPLAFIQQLKANKGLPSLPRLQNVVKIPDIDWTCYQVDATGIPSLVYRTYRSDCHVFRRNIFTAENTSSASAQAGSPFAVSLTKRLFPHVGRETVSCPLTPLATRASSPHHTSSPKAPPALAAATDHLHSLPSTPTGDPVAPSLSNETVGSRAASPCDRPSTPRQGWTAEDDNRLRELLTIFPQEANQQQWHKRIAAALGCLDHAYIGEKVEAYLVQQRTPTDHSSSTTVSRQPSTEPSQGLAVSPRRSKRTASRALVADTNLAYLHMGAGRGHGVAHPNYFDDDGDDDDFVTTPKKKRQPLVRRARPRRSTPKSNADRPSVGRAGTTRTSGYLYNVPLASLRTLDMSDDDSSQPSPQPLPSLAHSASSHAALLAQAPGNRQQPLLQPTPVGNTQWFDCAGCHTKASTAMGWTCRDCPASPVLVQVCVQCKEADLPQLEHHRSTHVFERLNHQPTVPYFYDKDYAGNAEGEFGYLN